MKRLTKAEDVDVLVALAFEREKNALEILRAYVRRLYKSAQRARGASVEIPASVRELMFEVFINGEPRAKPGPKPTTSGQRNTTIASLVMWVSKAYGFPIYGNAEHRGNPNAPMTALRLVGEEAGLDELTVEEIYVGRLAMLKRSARGPVNLARSAGDDRPARARPR
jgi:hypothetical protein